MVETRWLDRLGESPWNHLPPQCIIVCIAAAYRSFDLFPKSQVQRLGPLRLAVRFQCGKLLETIQEEVTLNHRVTLRLCWTNMLEDYGEQFRQRELDSWWVSWYLYGFYVSKFNVYICLRSILFAVLEPYERPSWPTSTSVMGWDGMRMFHLPRVTWHHVEPENGGPFEFETTVTSNLLILASNLSSNHSGGEMGVFRICGFALFFDKYSFQWISKRQEKRRRRERWKFLHGYPP